MKFKITDVYKQANQFSAEYEDFEGKKIEIALPLALLPTRFGVGDEIEIAPKVSISPNDFIEKVLATESNDFESIRMRLHEIRTIRLLHAAIGKVTEAGEFIDALKKFIFYGKELDTFNLLEELGDGNWYDGIAIDELNSSFEEVWETVIAKLVKRYGITFDNEKAISRDLTAERYIIERKGKDME